MVREGLGSLGGSGRVPDGPGESRSVREANFYCPLKRELKSTGLQKLSERRRKLCLSFAQKSLKHEKFKTWFKPNTKLTVTRQAQPKFCEVYRRTERFEKSPLSYLTGLLNNNFK